MKTKPLQIDLLVTDADTQSRIAISGETVDQYAELISEAGKDWPLPPLDVFHDGSRYMVADGFHRVMGATKAKRASVPCKIHKGTATDARIFGMTANDQHGLRMTQADKRACVEWLLDNQPKMTQKTVSVSAGVTERTVRRIVAERKGNRTMSYSGEDGRTDSDGTTPPELEGKGKENPGDVGVNSEWEDVDYDSAPVQTPPAKVGEECPNCGRKKWRDGRCAKCGHVLGESLGDRDQQYVDERLASAISYGEYLLRAIGDARESATESQHEKALDLCDQILTELKGWRK